jgi:hypothetical protein
LQGDNSAAFSRVFMLDVIDSSGSNVGLFDQIKSWVDPQIGASSNTLTLGPGIYEVHMEMTAAKGVAPGPVISSYSAMTSTFRMSVVPVPAAVWLFGSVLAGLGWFRRKTA